MVDSFAAQSRPRVAAGVGGATMGLMITVNFVNRSNDSNNSEIVIFAARPSGPPLHTLRFHNNSGSTQTFVCFQTLDHATAGLVPAWFAMPVANGVEVNFTWQETCDLVWMETGPLAPGIQFSASQVVPAALGTSNQIALTFTDGVFSFADQGAGGPPNDFQITAHAIPANTASIGIGMAGSPTYIVQAQPFITTTITPSINYWVTVADVTQGELMDLSTLGPKAPVVFPPDVTSMTATLNPGGTTIPPILAWKIQQGLV
jgi:rhizosphere induced protein